MITVVIPTYNRAFFLGKTVESVLNQTFRNFEVIVVDDGSTDNTRELVQEFISCPNFRYIYQPNKGRSIARNEGARNAIGNWIMYLDSDDYLEKDALEKLYQLAEEAKDSAIVYANFAYISANQQLPDQSGLFTGKSLNKNLFFDMIDNKFCFTKTGTYLIKKELDLDIKGFATEFEPSEDLDYAIKSLLGANVSYISDIVLYVERHDENTDDREIEKSHIKVWKYYLNYQNIWDQYLSLKEINKIKQAFTFRIANLSYELNEHRQAFIYYTRLIKSKPSILFDRFVFKQLFASLLPVKLKKMVKGSDSL